jgi:hypothetical protein
MKTLSCVLLLLCLLVSSCTKKEKTWGAQEMWFHALARDPSIELVPIPNHEAARRVLCEQYRQEGCVVGSGKRVKVRLVELLVIQYDSVKNACLAARAIGQWYGRNWLMDDVAKEPVLETFVQSVFEAKKPKPTDLCE